jgi:NTE family protein
VTTAFVLSGGASHGAIQVGMLQALAARGIQPDLVFGASVGAVNAAWVAGDPRLDDLDALADVWVSLRTRDVFPLRPLRGLLGFLGKRDSLVPAESLRTLVARHLRFERLEDARIPICVVATEVTSGREVALTSGNALDAIIASASIPGVLPPVRIANQTLIDGGIVDNTPISNAIEAGASRIYVLPTGYACRLERPPRSALAITLQAISVLVQQRLIADVHALQSHADLRVIPPVCPLDVSPADFSHGRELIELSRVTAGRWLDTFEADGARADVGHGHDRTQGRRPNAG